MPDSSETLYVPIHHTRITGVVSIVTARLPGGSPTGLAFTSADALIDAMGEHQDLTSMSASMLRATLAPMGLHRIQIDPDFVGAPISRLPEPAHLLGQHVAAGPHTAAAVA